MVCRRVTFDFDQSFKKMLKPTLSSQVVIAPPPVVELESVHSLWVLPRSVYIFYKQYQIYLLYVMDPTKILYCT